MDLYIGIGNNSVETGSMVQLQCNYTKSPYDSLSRLGWTMGNQFESSIRIVDLYLYENPGEPHVIYYHPYRAPDYLVTINEMDDRRSGYSLFTITSAAVKDSLRYWCIIQVTRDIGITKDFVDIVVLGKDFSNFFCLA